MKIAFLLAGASSNVGKTTISAGLMHYFKSKNLRVQAFKCGPDYLDPTFHHFVTQRPSINLDLHMMGQDGLKASFHHAMQDADVGIVEGVMGMYDGQNHSLDNGSAAHLSRLLGLPVILVVDGSGVSTSLAAQVMGYQNLDPRVDLKGVIINKVGSAMHYHLLSQALDTHTQTKALGYLMKDPSLNIDSRHLGLKPAHEVDDLKALLDKVASTLETGVDMAFLKGLAYQSPGTHVWPTDETHPRLRLGIARDEAFYFYYEENLNLLKRCGVDLVAFSPLHDGYLPENLDGLYFGGGYPELHVQALSNNLGMKEAIYKAHLDGMPIYAECGGMMYLCQSLEDMSGGSYDMVGIFKGRAHMTPSLQRFGYVNVELTRTCLLGQEGSLLRGHEFHRSRVDWQDQALVYQVEKAYGMTKQWTCGAMTGHTLGAYAHIHFNNQPRVIEPWLNLMIKRRHNNG